MLATILAGMLSPMQSAVNGQLGHWLQDGNACAVISFASGLVVMFLLLWREKKPGNNLRQFLLWLKTEKFLSGTGLPVSVERWWYFLKAHQPAHSGSQRFKQHWSPRYCCLVYFAIALVSVSTRKILYPLSHHRCIICGYCYDFCCVTAVAFYLFHLTCHSSVLSWFACRMAARWKCKSSWSYGIHAGFNHLEFHRWILCFRHSASYSCRIRARHCSITRCLVDVSWRPAWTNVYQFNGHFGQRSGVTDAGVASTAGQLLGSVLIDVLIPSLGNTVYLVTIIGTLFALVGAIVTTIPEYRTSKTMKKMEV